MEPILEEEELAALRAAMGSVVGAAPTPSSILSPASADASSIALIAEDRAASQARPNGVRIATRFARAARKLVARYGLRADIAVASVETVEVATLRDELTAAWTRAIVAKERPGAIIIAVSGSLVEVMAARLLGAPGRTSSDPMRPPSPTALSLFTPAGEALARAAAEAWQEEQDFATTVISDPARLARAFTEVANGVAVLATLTIGGDAAGQIRMLARPETLIAPRPAVEPIRVPASVIQEILGAVPVELSVELGRARMTMSELAALEPGSVIPLDRCIDDLLPVRCQGMVKAQGRACVARNAMAVEIVANKETNAA